MNRITKLIILLSALMFTNNSKASNDIKTDTIKLVQTVNDFYDWYISVIKGKNCADFMPRFVETENGMTSLDFSKYIENLKAYGFSDSLIIKEKKSYSNCIENLRTIKFSDFKKTVFTSLDEYEQANCDFGNCYRWIGSQEPRDGIRIQNIQFIATDTALVSIEYFDFDYTDSNIKYYGGENSLIMKKINNDWYIDKVDSFSVNCLIWVTIEE